MVDWNTFDLHACVDGRGRREGVKAWWRSGGEQAVLLVDIQLKGDGTALTTPHPPTHPRPAPPQKERNAMLHLARQLNREENLFWEKGGEKKDENYCRAAAAGTLRCIAEGKWHTRLHVATSAPKPLLRGGSGHMIPALQVA